MPRIYVACVASYNAGQLHGAWIDIDSSTDASDIAEAITKMIESASVSGAEEYRIDDHDGWMGLDPSRWSEDHLPILAGALDDHGQAFAAMILHDGEQYWAKDSVTAAEESFRDRYQGTYDSLEDWAEEFLDSTGQLESIPQELRRYFDYASWARDASLGGEICAVEYAGETYVFTPQ